MFTGLIEAVCTVKSVSRRGSSMKIDIDLGHLAAGCKIGDSIAVNGTCLTVTKIAGSIASFDASQETLEKSAITGLKGTSKVNIERAMSPDSRFGGHFVLGHVDGVAKIKSIEQHGQYADITISAEPQLMSMMVPKGSVAVNGISLTIAKLNNNSFSIAVIPETMQKTTLGSAKPGDVVNIEVDIIIKAVKKQLEQLLPQSTGFTAEKLREMGF